ncbi:heme-binding protein [Algoriphagus sp.]|uniref:heme-binding protein n=1 Tax=Algoriphagus sp. TaxID=1872435 RepID=UPI0025E1630D|nr:heme-binding protein [Algoriphagus sp.]
MANVKSNPLESLDLSGLKHKKGLENLSQTRGFEAEALTPDATFGFLESLKNTSWEGTGFNLIEIPNMNQAKPGPPPADKFKLILNKTSESIIFSEIGGDIVNRGNAQGDIAFKGLHYLQQVSDVILNEGIHLETGLFLNLPGGTDPNVQPTIARLGSIPHGDSILLQGKAFKLNGGPQFSLVDNPLPNIPPADPRPFTLDPNGNRVNDTSPIYLSILNNAVPPAGIDKDIIMNPNKLLADSVKGQNITETIVILLDANPINGVGNVDSPIGGITNIPFVNVNANAKSATAILWIETVKEADGTTFKQLQYTQTVILDFPVFFNDNPGPIVQINWPHISVATLRMKPN